MPLPGTGERRHQLLFVAAGASGIASYYLLENIALVYTAATAVGVIVAASPLITALIQAAQGDRSALRARFFLGFLLTMGGLILVGIGSEQATGTIRTDQPFDAMSLLGDALALLAALVWALYSILVKKISDLGYETIGATKHTFFWGLAFIISLTFFLGGPFPALETLVEPVEIANLLSLGAIASAACFVTWGVSVKHLDAATSTTYIYLVPAITATASIIILGEPLTPTIVCGVAFTVTGLVISQSKPKCLSYTEDDS